MKRYCVFTTALYNGEVVVEAENEKEAMAKASEELKKMEFRSEVGEGHCFGEAVADFAEELED